MRLNLHQKWRNLRNLALLLISSTGRSSPFAVTCDAVLVDASFVENSRTKYFPPNESPNNYIDSYLHQFAVFSWCYGFLISCGESWPKLVI